MKFRADIRLNMRMPELETSSEDMIIPTIKLWLATELKMPLEMLMAISVDKIMKVEDTPQTVSETSTMPTSIATKSKSSGIKKFSRSFIFRSFLIGFILRLCNSLIMADIVSYHTYLIIVDYCKFLRMAENGIDYIES